jgi:hypothetical protein
VPEKKINHHEERKAHEGKEFLTADGDRSKVDRDRWIATSRRDCREYLSQPESHLEK